MSIAVFIAAAELESENHVWRKLGGACECNVASACPAPGFPEECSRALDCIQVGGKNICDQQPLTLCNGEESGDCKEEDVDCGGDDVTCSANGDCVGAGNWKADKCGTRKGC